MADEIRLTLRARPERDLGADAVAPDRLAALGERAIAALPVACGRAVGRLGDWFDVRTVSGHAARVQVEGDAGGLALVHGLGSGMTGGTLVIEGGAGRLTGAGMRGGALTVRGSVSDDAGAAMAGGVLVVDGDAGDRLGAAPAGGARGMTGGEIVVHGSAGADAAAFVRRGLVAVGRNAGLGAARGMIAGTLVVIGVAGPGSGRGMKRGTLAAIGGVAVPASYRYACTYRPPHLALVLTHLVSRYAMPVTASSRVGRYRRYSGDLAELGKGEILAWTAD